MFQPSHPLTDRERAALRLWGGLIAGLLGLDYTLRGKHTCSEGFRAIRRRVGWKGWALGWGAFAVWFFVHVLRGDGSS